MCALSCPDLGGKALTQLLTNEMLAVGSSLMAYIMLRGIPSIPSLWRVFIMNGCCFLKCFFCIYWDDHMIFILNFICGISHWFADAELSLHFHNKFHWVVAYDPFNVLLNSICYYFVFTYQKYWPVIFFSCSVLVWFWYQDNAGLLKWVWKCSLHI